MAKRVMGHNARPLSKPGQRIAFNHEHLILRDIKMHHLLRRKLKEMPSQTAACSAMGNDDCIRSNLGKPSHDLFIKITEALSFRWRLIPWVRLPADVIDGIAFGNFSHGHTAPCAEMYFFQAAVGAITLRGKSHFGPYDFHRLACS